MRITYKLSLTFAAALGLASACGSSGHSRQLLEARAAYAQAENSKAARLSPDQLFEAKQYLDRAESNDDGGAMERHLAYVSHRTSLTAMATADAADAGRTAERARATKEELLEAQAAATQQRLDAERAAHADAEARYNAAIAALAQYGLLKEEQRGLVITLSGEVLFKTAMTDLMPIAAQRLDQVAAALVDMDPSRTIIVEGHTDSRGSDASNVTLSQGRADSVRNYLVARGVEAIRIRAVGVGEDRPVANNESAEGRANNRRVEIIISKR